MTFQQYLQQEEQKAQQSFSPQKRQWLYNQWLKYGQAAMPPNQGIMPPNQGITPGTPPNIQSNPSALSFQQLEQGTSQPDVSQGLGNTMKGTNVNVNQPSSGGAPVTPEPIGQIKPVTSPSSGSQFPTTPAYTPFTFYQVIDAMKQKLNSNQQLIDARNKIIMHLYDRPLTEEEKLELSPEIRDIIESGDRTSIDTQLRLINDQIKGRTDTLDQSMQFLVDGYEKTMSSMQSERDKALQNIKDFVTQYGSNAPQALKALYGQGYLDELKAQGIDIEAFSKLGLPTVSEARYKMQYGDQTSNQNITVDIPGTTIAARTNNPLNIKYSTTTASFGATNSGISNDGGKSTFSAFESPEAGLDAAVQLLQSPLYSNLTLDAAMKKWSDGGYGAEVSPSLLPNQIIGSLSSDQMNQLVSDMAKRESGATIQSSLTENGTLLTDDGLMIAAQNYLNYGTMPSLGLGQAKDVKETRAQIINLAGKLAAGADPASIRAGIKAQTSALTQQQQYLSTMQRAVDTVDLNLNILMGAADKVNKFDSPLANEWKNLALRRVIGSGDLAAYTSALQTVRNEYQFILARGGKVTDVVREEAQSLIPDNITKRQLQQVIDVLKKEGQNVLAAAQTTVQNLQSGIGTTSTDNDPLGIR